MGMELNPYESPSESGCEIPSNASTEWERDRNSLIVVVVVASGLIYGPICLLYLCGQ